MQHIYVFLDIAKFTNDLTLLHTPDRGFAHLVFILFLHFFLSFAYFLVVATGSLMSSLTRSVHLFLSLSLFLFFLLKSSFIILFSKLSSFRQNTCSNQVHLDKIHVQTRFDIFFKLCFQYCFVVLRFFIFQPW